MALLELACMHTPFKASGLTGCPCCTNCQGSKTPASTVVVHQNLGTSVAWSRSPCGGVFGVPREHWQDLSSNSSCGHRCHWDCDDDDDDE